MAHYAYFIYPITAAIIAITANTILAYSFRRAWLVGVAIMYTLPPATIQPITPPHISSMVWLVVKAATPLHTIVISIIALRSRVGG